MKARFSSIKHPYLYRLRKIRFSILGFFALFALFLFIVDKIDHVTLEKQYESLDSAIKRDIVHCYSVEGTYPPNLDYMKEHYGLTYNENIFYVDYHPISANLYPDYTIIILEDRLKKKGVSNAPKQ